MQLANLCVAAYGAVKKTGVLEIAPAKRLFTQSYFFYKRFLEDPFDDLLKARPELLSGGHVLDVGANLGYTALLFSKYISPEYKVFAFEPDKENFKLLEQEINRRRLNAKIEAVKAAVGKEEGMIDLWYNPSHHADHRVATEKFKETVDGKGIEQVKLWSIDSFLAKNSISAPVAFLKSDVQGFELPVMEGMRQTIEENPQMVIAFEYCPEEIIELGYDPADLFALLKNYGFCFSLVEKGKSPVALDLEKLDKITNERGYIDILCERKG